MKKTNKTNNNNFCADAIMAVAVLVIVLGMIAWILWKIISNSFYTFIYLLSDGAYGYIYSSNLMGDFADVVVGNTIREVLVNGVGLFFWIVLALLILWACAYLIHITMKTITRFLLKRLRKNCRHPKR